MADIKVIIVQILNWCTWSKTYEDMVRKATVEWLLKDGE